MASKKEPVLGIMLGDHAGSSPEMAAKVVLAKKDPYTAVLVGNKERFNISISVVEGAEKLKLVDWDGKERPRPLADPLEVYFYNIPCGKDIQFGKITRDSGEVQYQTLAESVRLNREGKLDGLLMCPITKAAFHAADKHYKTEFELFAELYGVPETGSVVAAKTYYRSTVVGHVPFKDIYGLVTTKRIIATCHRLLDMMQYFMPKEECRVAVAALNPHAGDNGIFGDEEKTVIQPAIDSLCAEGYNVVGPWPCDTAINRVKRGDANGIVYLYHDQGNIAQKASEFGGLRLIYVGFPGLILSVGHGPAYGKAGKGTADPSNLIASMDTLYHIARQQINN